MQLPHFADVETRGQRRGSDSAKAKQHSGGQVFFQPVSPGLPRLHFISKGDHPGHCHSSLLPPPPPALQSSLFQPLLLRHFGSCLMRANFQEPCLHQWEECGAPELPRRWVEVEIPQGRNAHLVSHKFNENGTKIQARLLQ